MQMSAGKDAKPQLSQSGAGGDTVQAMDKGKEKEEVKNSQASKKLETAWPRKRSDPLGQALTYVDCDLAFRWWT